MKAGHSAALGSSLHLVRDGCLVRVPATQATHSHRLPWPSHHASWDHCSESPWGVLINCTNRAGFQNPTLVLLCDARNSSTMEKGSMPWLLANPVSSNAFGGGAAGWQESQAVMWEGLKKGLFLGWRDKRAPWNVTGMPCELLGIPSSSQYEGLRVDMGSSERVWTPHLLKLVASVPFHSWQKKRVEGRENGRRCTLWPRFACLKVIDVPAFLLLCFSSFSFVFSFLSSHAKVQSNQEPLLGQESLVLWEALW